MGYWPSAQANVCDRTQPMQTVMPALLEVFATAESSLTETAVDILTQASPRNARCPLRAALHLNLIDRISPCAICATTSAPSARAPLCQPAGRRGTAQWFLSRCTHTPEAATADQRTSVAASSARCARERRGRRRHRIGGAGVPCDCRCNCACTAMAHNAALHPTLPPS